MSLLFTATFDGHPINVLQLRGRCAFLAHELGVAAGYAGDGQRFVDQIVHEWAASLDEDDDLAQVVGKELAVLIREVPLPPTTTSALVLFPTGAELALLRSHVRNSRALVCFLHDEVLSRVIAFNRANTPARGRSGDGGGGVPVPAEPPSTLASALARAIAGEPGPTPSPGRALADAVDRLEALGKGIDTIDRRKAAYQEIIALAGDLRDEGLLTPEQWAALRVEAVEELLGRSMRAPLPAFGFDLAMPPSAA